MQLKKLWIKDYKNLKDFSLDFEKGKQLSILIGNNGSGKSNVLEAISGIFAEWNEKPSSRFDSNYKIEYDYNGKNVVVEKNESGSLFYVEETLFEDSRVKTYLPSNVIALYSGEDLRLYENFYLPKYEAYLKDVYQNGYTGKMGMCYANKDFWNISLLILLSFYNRFPNIKEFLESELGISEDSQIQHIRIKFTYKDYDRNTNSLLKNFINTINPTQEKGKEYSITEWRESINSLVVNTEAEPTTTFHYLLQAFTPKSFNIIEKIQILFSNGVTLESLSEGEKKLILIKAVLEFIADENSILLLDEPDANIHEARKTKLYKLLKDTPNRDVVMTTHSPILAKIADEKELIYLESREGIVSEISMDKLRLVRTLASNEWNIMDAGIFLNTDKPLVLFEGKSDVDFVKRAIELLKDDDPKYGTIDVDFLSFNGTGKAPSFIKNVRDCVATKKIIVFFDRDDAGRNAMVEISGWPKDSDEIKNAIDYISADNLLKAAFYPYTNEVTSGEFLLEDYFSEAKITEIITNLISGKKHPVKGLSNLSKRVKDTLANKYKEYSKEDFEGFKPLLDKLLELLEIN